MLKKMTKRTLSLLLALCLLASMCAVGVVSAAGAASDGDIFVKVEEELASTGNFAAEKAMEKAYDIGMRAFSCGLDAAADATGKSGKPGWETAISFVNDWVFKDASEVAIAEVEELCKEILNELSQIEEQINSSISIVDSMVSKNIIETAKTAVNTQWDTDVTGPLTTYGAKTAFDAYKQYVSDAIDGKKSKEQMQAELDALIDDFYLMYNGDSPLGADKREAMFTSASVNNNFEKMIKALADNLDKSGSVTEKAAYFAYMAYPFSHQQYTYVYNMMEKQLVYLLLTEMMYNEYLFQQGEYLKNSENYGPDSREYQGYDEYQQRFYDMMMTNAGCVNEHVGNMLETKITVDTTSGISLGLEDYMKPEDAVSVPLTFPYAEDPVSHVMKPTYHSSYDFWDEAVDMANFYDDGGWSVRDDTNISDAEYIGETVWFKRVMTHSTYGSKVFYIIDPDKLDSNALNVRNYMNKIDLMGYKDPHTPTCDYINLMQAMTDGINTFAATDSYDCASIAPLFAPNAFLANGNKVNNYLSGYLPTSSGNNYMFTPMRRYENSKWGLASSYVKYKVVDGNKQYAAGVSIDKDSGSDELDTRAFDDSSTAYEDDRFTVILANQDNSFKRNLSAVVTGNTEGRVQVQPEKSGLYLENGDSMQVDSGTMLNIRMDGNDYFINSLTVTRKDGDKDTTVTLLEADDFDHLSVNADGFYELNYPMPYSDAVVTLDVSDKPVSYTATIGTVDGGTGSFSEVESVLNVTAAVGDEVHVYFTSDKGAGSYWSPRFTETATGYNRAPDIAIYDMDAPDGCIAFECVFIMPNCDVTVSTVFDDFPLTATLGTLEHCSGTMGTRDLAGYGIDSITDTHKQSVTVDKAGKTVVAIMTVEKGYFPGSSTSTDTVTIRDASTNSPIDVKQYVFTQPDDQGNVIYYVEFPMPDTDVIIDMICTEGLTVVADTSGFVYDSNSDPSSYILLVDPMTNETGTTVMLPNQGNYFWCYVYSDAYHYLSHMKMVGADSGKVYYDADTTEIVDERVDQLADNYGEVDFFVHPEKIDINFWFHGATTYYPESLIITPTFTRNEVPMPTEPPTEAPTDPPVKYTAMLSSFSGGIPTFSLGSVAVTKKAVQGEEVPFYVTAPKDYVLKDLTVTGKSNTSYSYRETAEPYAQGDDLIWSFAFDMPAENVVINGKWGPAPTEAPTEAPTDPPTEAPTSAPTEPVTEPPTEAPTDAPEPVEHGIRTYDELVEFARLVNEDYANYGSANVYLENNILAPADSEWTQGIGSINSDKPFNGTFNGNGYCIIGLNINNSEYGSLFEHLGENGVIKDLMIFDSRFKTEPEYAAGIVILNEGTIDHCISGINVLGKTKITLPNGNKINPADYNSMIKGTFSAGIAVYNVGVITGCRNGSLVTGDYCAGIATRNRGSIYGSTNNGAIGTDTARCLAAGGITAANNGSIASSYNSGKIHCGDKNNMGTVTVYNGSEEVNNVFFNNINSVPPIRSDEENVPLNETDKAVDNTDMLTPAFVEMLAGVSDDTITWVQAKYGKTYFNQGYPTILGRFLEQNTQYLTKEITITGLMHSSLKTSASELDTDSDEYQAISGAANGEILSAYAVATTDANGKYVPAELWIAGSVQITVPLEDSGLAPVGADGESQDDPAYGINLAVLDDDGEVAIVAPDSVIDGKAVFTLAAPRNFAVVKETSFLYGDTDLDGEVTIIDATVIQRYLVSLETLSDIQKKAADVDGDGDVTIVDATLIQRKLAGIIKKFPVEEEA